MGVYIVMSRLTDEGRKSIRKDPNRILEVNEELQRIGIKVREQYAILGEHDFMSIVEAHDPEQMMKMSMDMGSRGTVYMTTYAAVPIETFIKNV